MSCDFSRSLPKCGPRRRLGMALVLVMVVLTLGLGISLALLQAQTVQMFLQHNAALRDQARQAALSGASAALQQIHQQDWAGVNTSFERSLGKGRSFRVSYAAGDSRLAPTDPDYWLWPYRVTIAVTGRAQDTLNPRRSVEYPVELVVQLVPERLQPVPRAWAESVAYTLFQRNGSGKGDIQVEVPCQVQGTVRLQEELRYMSRYPQPQDAAFRLAEDWNTLQLQGQQDCRTFTGTLELPRNKQSNTTLTLLQKLGVSVQDRPASSQDRWFLGQAILHYQLYPGGPKFQAEAVPSYLQGMVLDADPKTNPLGLFYRLGSIEVGSNVQVHGTLMTYAFWNGSLYLSGNNITIEPVSILPLAGQTAPVQLPAVILLQHLEVRPPATAEIRGAVYVSDRLRVEVDPQLGGSFRIAGPVSLRRLDIRPGTWEQNGTWWKNAWNQFLQSEHPFFPLWLAEQYGLDSTPPIVLSGPAGSVLYHWPDGNRPLFDYPAPNQGLRWDLIRWEEPGP